MSVDSPVVLIHSTLRWPLAARLAIRFRDLGCRVHSICPTVHPLHFVSRIERCYSIRSWSTQQSLIEAIESTRADYIVPTDDRAIWQLHALAVSHPQHHELILRSLGDLQAFPIVRSRASLLSLADSLHVQIPRTVLVHSEEEAASLVKRDGTSGGRGVMVVSTPKELLEAYHKLRQNPSVLARLKRRLVDDDVLAFFRFNALPPEEISLQAFVAGAPANAMYACFRGRLLACLQVRTICAQHATGAALIVERINDPRIEEAGRRLAEALRLSGFFGLDFLLENNSGQPYLLELNPRATQLGHLPLEDSHGGDTLADALWRAWTGNAPVLPITPTPISRRIAFYPQALVLGSGNSLLTSAYLDRPDGELALIRELSQTGWPERRLLYRLFHQVYSAPPDKPVVFQTTHDSKEDR
jgi:hypothetical protein